MLKYFKEARIYLIFISLFNFLLLFLPMLNILSYESSVFNSILLYFTVFYYFTSKNISARHSKDWITLLAFILIPFLILLIKTAAFSNCGVCSGVQFYFLIVAPSVLLGYAVSRFVDKSKSFLFRTAVIFTFFLLFALESAAELYLNPQMYFFNQIIGYFPGTVYDEYISISPHFVIYRILTNILAIYLLILSEKNIRLRIKFIYAIIPLIVFFAVKPYFGFATDIDRAEEELEGKIATEHFTIIYDKSISSRNAEFYSKLHEFYYSELSKTFEITDQPGITSFIFKNTDQKSELFGARNADIAKPWLNQIYLTESSIEKNLKHELTHVFLGNYGAFPLKLPSGMDPVIIEGFASAVTNNFDGHSIHYPAKLAYENGFAAKGISLIHGMKFFTQSPLISYSYAGSFIRYLLDNYNKSQVFDYYGTGNIAESLGMPDSVIGERYFSYLDGLPKVGSMKEAHFYFGGSPIIGRRCLRSAANNRKKAEEKYGSKEFEQAYKYYSAAYSENSEYANIYGIAASLNALGEYERALDILLSNSEKFRNTRWEYPYALLTAEEYYKNNDLTESEILLDSVITSNIHPYYVNSAIILKTIIADSINTALIDSISLYNYYHSKVFSDKLEYFVTPLLRSAGQNDSLLKNIISSFANEMSGFERHEWFELFRITRLAEKLGLFGEALEILNAEKEIGNDFYHKAVFREEIRKIKWLKKQIK